MDRSGMYHSPSSLALTDVITRRINRELTRLGLERAKSEGRALVTANDIRHAAMAMGLPEFPARQSEG